MSLTLWMPRLQPFQMGRFHLKRHSVLGFFSGLRNGVMIIASFGVVNPLKYPSNACLSCLDRRLYIPVFIDNGYSCWNAIFMLSKCHRCLTSALPK